MDLVIHRKASLEGVGEGWDDSCYALFRPLNANELNDYLSIIDEIRGMRQKGIKITTKMAQERLEKSIKVAKDHFISGKGKDENGNEVELQEKHLDVIFPVAQRQISLALINRNEADKLDKDFLAD